VATDRAGGERASISVGSREEEGGRAGRVEFCSGKKVEGKEGSPSIAYSSSLAKTYCMHRGGKRVLPSMRRGRLLLRGGKRGEGLLNAAHGPYE